MKLLKVLFTLLCLSMLGTQTANAALILTIERISDTEGLLTATGSIDIDVSNTVDGMGFDATIDNNSPVTILSQNLMLGDDAFRAMRFRNPTQLLLRMMGSYERGDIFSGQMHFQLASGTLREIGYVSQLFNNDIPGERYGTVEYIAPRAVSEPSPLALMGISILGLALVRRKK